MTSYASIQKPYFLSDSTKVYPSGDYLSDVFNSFSDVAEQLEADNVKITEIPVGLKYKIKVTVGTSYRIEEYMIVRPVLSRTAQGIQDASKLLMDEYATTELIGQILDAGYYTKREINNMFEANLEDVLLTDGTTITEEQQYNVLATIKDTDADSETGKMGYKVINPNTSLSSQMDSEDTVYEINGVVDLDGATVSVPSGCSINFVNGSIKNGTLALDGTFLDGNVVIRDCVVSGSVKNNDVYVDWFAVGDGETDDSQAMRNAVAILNRKGGKLIFGTGKTYIHGDGIQDESDTNKNKHTGYSYQRASSDSSSSNYLHAAGSSTIGRDIVLRFLGCEGVVIEGNGSSIVSNENNGICMHNQIMFFGGCTNCTLRNIKLDGKRLERVTNAGLQFNDGGATGSFPDYNQSLVNIWKDGTWTESSPSDNVQKGYNLISNLYVAACNNMVFENIESDNGMMDGMMINKSDSYSVESLIHDIKVVNSRFSYNARTGFDVGQGWGIEVDSCFFSKNGYYSDDTLDTVGSSNHGGFATELESKPINGRKIQATVTNCEFKDNDEGGLKFGPGSENCVCSHNIFNNSDFVCSLISASITDLNRYKLAENNIIEYCNLHNSRIGASQAGTVIRNNIITFDKNFNPRTKNEHCMYIDTSINPNLSGGSRNNPIIIEHNNIECDITDMTTTINGVEYLDASVDALYARGQGRIYLSGNIIFRYNTMKNICPSQKNYQGSSWNSGSYIFLITIYVLQYHDNTFSFDIDKIYYTPKKQTSDTASARMTAFEHATYVADEDDPGWGFIPSYRKLKSEMSDAELAICEDDISWEQWPEDSTDESAQAHTADSDWGLLPNSKTNGVIRMRCSIIPRTDIETIYDNNVIEKGNISLSNPISINRVGTTLDAPNFKNIYVSTSGSFLESRQNFEFYNTELNKPLYYKLSKTRVGASNYNSNNVAQQGDTYRFLENASTCNFSNGDLCYVTVMQFTDNHIPKLFLTDSDSSVSGEGVNAVEVQLKQTVHDSLTITKNVAVGYFTYNSAYDYFGLQTNSAATGSDVLTGALFVFYKVTENWVDSNSFTGANRTGTYSDAPTNLLLVDRGFTYYATDLAKEIIWNGTTWVDHDGFDPELPRTGTTAQRPTLTSDVVGFVYFDTDLQKNILWNGTKWTDVNGSDPAAVHKGTTAQRPELSFLTDKGFEFFDTTVSRPVYFDFVRKYVNGNYSGNANPYRYISASTIGLQDGEYYQIVIVQFKDNKIPKVYLSSSNSSLEDAVEIPMVQTVHSSTITQNTAVGYFTYTSGYTYVAVQHNTAAAGETISTTNSSSFFHYVKKWIGAEGFTAESHAGTTANRPSTLNSGDVGFTYFDTDLGKPIYAKTINSGTGAVDWVDANGDDPDSNTE